MSSLFAHAAAGLALAGRGPKLWGWRFVTMAAALAPDLDYPLEWWCGIRFPIRCTHSIGFCLGVTALGAVFLLLLRDPHWRRRSLVLTAAVFSHLAMDTLVGVYPEPWLWPASGETFRLPFGILPSAGRLSLENPYLYRNLAIEAGVLGPLIWLGLRGGHSKAWRIAFAVALILGASSIGFGLRRG